MGAAFRVAFSATGTEACGATFYSASVALLSGDTVYVMFGCSDSTPAAPTGVKWDPTGANQSLTSVGDQACGPFGRASIWRGQSLTPATAVFRVTYAATKSEQVAGGVLLTGVDTTTPNGTVGTNTGNQSTSATATATTTAGQFVLGMCHNVNTAPAGATTFTPTSGNTERFDAPTAPSGFDAITGADQTAAGSSTNTTWTISQTSGGQDWRAFAIPINDAPASTTLGVLGKRLWILP